jgi:hypothetical protein
MATLSPLDWFQKAGGNEILLFREKGHGHYAELGNRLLTDTAFEFLKTSGWLNSCERR